MNSASYVVSRLAFLAAFFLLPFCANPLAAWSVVGLAAVGWLFSSLYQRYETRRREAVDDSATEALVASMEADALADVLEPDHD